MSKEDRVIELLEELVRWTKVTGIPSVKKLLLEILKNPEEKIAYQASDGKSSKEVAKQTNVSYVTITLWWKKWIKVGIAESVRAPGGSRARRVFSLDDFGIEVPAIEEVTKEDRGGN